MRVLNCFTYALKLILFVKCYVGINFYKVSNTL